MFLSNIRNCSLKYSVTSPIPDDVNLHVHFYSGLPACRARCLCFILCNYSSRGFPMSLQILHSYPGYPCFDYLQIYLKQRNLQRSSVCTFLPSLLRSFFWVVAVFLVICLETPSSVFPPLGSETKFQAFVKLFFITVINHNNYFLCFVVV